ncbi:MULTISPECIES: dihydroxyacetone kinase phosphoryl donor subunit DhaM [unclassified Streptomyces]|uniref:dihydroxyacetone kinase phosphoryl donor subunit DhaM n=1 Tax=unclassified Streptomyces TaxID=2593676 RepID=UPI0004758F75|nr:MULTISPECIES: dihydroxyacetone kinase phosphoryl donor subunit DhaM [unclassified Streptomyces]MYT29123.1 phosphoenolpyruvate--protein phosphotransferase [Streptomyces sp. SID8354]
MTPLVGIVLVSHRAEIALGVRSLVAEMAGPEVTVAAAGGTDDGRTGTSYARIRDALHSAATDAGVLLLPDLGSSVLTARLVLEDHPAIRAVLADAPFVEGAVAAAVTAATGAPLSTVAKAAEEARHFSKL